MRHELPSLRVVVVVVVDVLSQVETIIKKEKRKNVSKKIKKTYQRLKTQMMCLESPFIVPEVVAIHCCHPGCGPYTQSKNI